MDMKCHRAFLFVGLMTALGLWVQSSPAYADSIDLTNWNVSELNLSGDFVRVTLGTQIGGALDGNTTLSFQWFGGNALPPTGMNMDMIGWTGSIGVAVGGCATGWLCNEGPRVMNGFNSFLQFEKDGPGAPKPGLGPITFILDGSGLTFASFPLNTSGAQFAAHVRYDGSCSGFVSNGTTSSISSKDACAPIPEPTSLLLLGSGLAGLGLWGWRRRASAQTY